jgi:hypothetical protein
VCRCWVFLFRNGTTLVHSVRRPFGLTTSVGGNKPRLQTQSPRCNPLSLERESRQKEGGGAAVTIRVPPPTHSTARPHRLFSRVRGRSSPRRTSTHSPRLCHPKTIMRGLNDVSDLALHLKNESNFEVCRSQCATMATPTSGRRFRAALRESETRPGENS